MKKKKSSLVQNIALGFGALVFAALMAEVLLRIFYPTNPRGSFDAARYSVHEVTGDLRLIYKLRPNAVSDAHGVVNRINSDGFRDKDYALQKPAGLKRFIFLGDSVIYGYGLELVDTLPKQLERTFADSGFPGEVLNFGVSGYETEQEVKFFEMNGLKYHPDVVVVGYTLNDCRYASLEMDKFSELPGNYVYAAGNNPLRQLMTWVFDHSRLMQFLDERLRIQKKVKELRSYREPIRRHIEDRNRKERDPKDSPYKRLEETVAADGKRLGTSEGALRDMLEATGLRVSYDIGDSHWNVSEKAFRELKTLSEKYHFKVVVVIIPYFQELDKYALEPVHRFVADELKNMGFSVIDLLDFSRKVTAEYGEKISSDRVHLTPLGSALIAKYLYGEFLNQGVLIS